MTEINKLSIFKYFHLRQPEESYIYQSFFIKFNKEYFIHTFFNHGKN